MSIPLPQKPKEGFPFLPASYLQALGNIVATYAYLESAVEITIWAFLGLEYADGTTITAEMGAISRAQVLSILAESHLAATEYDTVRQRFLDALKEIDDARVRRNHFVHAMWKYESDKKARSIERLVRSAKGKLKLDSHHVTLSELQDLARDIGWLTAELRGFVEAVFPNAYVPWTTKERVPDSQKKG